MPISTIGQNGLNAPLSLTSPALTTPNLGTPSALVLTNATGTPSAINLSNATSLARAALPAGAVLQVVQAVKTDSYASTISSVWGDISGMSASITPISASNKILITVDMKGAGGQDYSVIRSRLLRGSTAIYVGDAASSRPQSMGQFYIASPGAAGGYYLAQLGGTFLDSPATTSSVTYKVQIGADGTSQVVFVNRTQGDRDNNYYDSRVAASITLMEIAA